VCPYPYFRCDRNGSAFADNWYRGADVVTGSVATASIAGHGWGAYQWYVRGWGPDGLGDWSNGGEFCCGKPIPVEAGPTELTWNDTQTSAAGWYQVWINDVTGGGRVKERAWWFNRSSSTAAGVANRFIELLPALTSGDYEWTIRAWSSVYGQGPWSEVQTFTVP